LYGYTGDILAAAGTVVVSFNYRVGVFGWGAFQPSDGAPSNVGLLDQQAALQWVQDNIAAFGGDRARVTLFGESAGAISISLHTVIASSQSLFAQAALESGTAMHGAGRAQCNLDVQFCRATKADQRHFRRRQLHLDCVRSRTANSNAAGQKTSDSHFESTGGRLVFSRH
jgi:carboxylesterase type B